ncbi:hypothetical protein AXK56_10520 [Tsukamurella pulmonis]|nr:hypothetical protein AXK56_10520 [Tsukamurella pulmonis]
MELGLYEDDLGYRWGGTSRCSRADFDLCLIWVGRNNGPALLFDFHFGGVVDLRAPDMAGIAASAWCGAEYPERTYDPPSMWVRMFKRNGYTHDGSRAPLPTEPIQLYRGCTEDGRYGMSWTTDCEIARAFAFDGLRGQPAGAVYTATVDPKHLLAYIGPEVGRGESEYVVDPAGLSDVCLSH